MDRQFDCMLHLAGEQTLPIYIGLMQFECPFHVIAVTEKTRCVGEIIRGQLRSGSSAELLDLPAYDIARAIGLINALIVKKPDKRWCFNLTGGTKPMFAAALEIAREKVFPACYVETSNKYLDWLLPLTGQTKENLRPSVEKVATFIQLADYEANVDFASQMARAVEEKREVVCKCWEQRRVIAKSYRVLSDPARHPGVPFRQGQFNGQGLGVELQGPPDYSGALQLGTSRWQFAPWMDLAQFAAGGWFECFVWLQTDLLLKKGLIKDRLFRVSPVERKTDGGNPIQEFDVAFTDGYYLSIVECKAGEVRQEHIQKLENLSRRFGGHFGRGVLAFADRNKIDKATLKRIENSGLICAVSGERMSRDPECILKANPGEILA